MYCCGFEVVLIWILVGNYVRNIKPFSTDFIPAARQTWQSKWISLALKMMCSAAWGFKARVLVFLKRKIIILQQALGLSTRLYLPWERPHFSIWFLLHFAWKCPYMRDHSWNVCRKYITGMIVQSFKTDSYGFGSLRIPPYNLVLVTDTCVGSEATWPCWFVDWFWPQPVLIRVLIHLAASEKDKFLWFFIPRKGRWKRQPRGTSTP